MRIYHLELFLLLKLLKTVELLAYMTRTSITAIIQIFDRGVS